MKLIFSHADKNQSFLSVDTIFGFGQAGPKYPNQFVLSLSYIVCNMLEIRLKFILIFGMRINPLAMGVIYFIFQ